MSRGALLILPLVASLAGCMADDPSTCGPPLGGRADMAEAFQDPHAAADLVASKLGDPRQGPWVAGEATTSDGWTLRVASPGGNFSHIAYEGTGAAPWDDDPQAVLDDVMDGLGLPASRAWDERPYSDGRLVLAQHALADGVASGDDFPEERVSDAFIRWYSRGDELHQQLIIHAWYPAEPGDAIVDADAAEQRLRQWLACARPGLDEPRIDLGVAASDGGPLYAIRELGWGHWFWVHGATCGGAFVVDAQSGDVIYADPDGC